MKRLASVLLAFVLFGATVPHAATLNPRSRCKGYPEARIFYETQSWWEPVPELGGQGHVHMGLCWPHGKTVSGDVRLDFVMIFHGNRGVIEKVKVQDDASYDYNFPVGLAVDASEDDVTVTKSVTIDTTKQHDGLRQWRIYVYFTHPNGNSQRTKAMYRVNVENVAGEENETGPKYSEYGGAGWYLEAEDGTDWGYQTARLDPDSFLKIAQCVSGTWTPEVDLDFGGTTEYLVTVDPDFHAGNPGTIIRQGVTYDGPVSIDTTALSVGWHKLVLHTAKRVGDEENGGVFSYPFRICAR